MQRFLDRLQQPVADAPQVIGAAVAVNGKVVAIDVFESTPLFKKLWPKLLRSYALEALHAAESDAENIGKACPTDTALVFLNETFNAEVEGTETKQGVCTTRRTSENVAVFSASVDAEAMPSAPQGFGGLGGFGGQGGGVHTSAFAK